MPPPLPLLAAFQVSVTVNDQDYTPLALFGDAKAFDFVYYEQPTLWCVWPLSLSVGGACLLRTCTCLCIPPHASALRLRLPLHACPGARVSTPLG